MDSSTNSPLAERFQEGVCLANTANYERANDALLDCVTGEPGNAEFVAEFLANLSRKFRAAGNVRLPNGELHADLAQAWADRNWPELRRSAPRHLSFNPWHVPTLLALADAAGAEGEHEVELSYLQMALEAAPNDLAVHRRGGNVLAKLRRFDEALTAWQRVIDQHPEDAEAARALARLTVERCRQRGGLESTMPLAPHTNGARKAARPSAPQEAVIHTSAPAVQYELSGPVGVKRSPIQQLEAAIREYPARVELYAQITPLYLEKGRDYDAERLLAKGLQDTDNDPRVRQLWEDVTMIRLEKKLIAAREQVAKEDNPNSRGELDKLIRERDRFETETFISRCKREPDNAAVRVELGKRLRQSGKVNEGAAHFQQALNDPAQKCFAALELGECYRELHEYPQALRYYRLASASATEPDQLACRKEALRQAARLAAKIKLFGVAQRYISELVRVDPTYADSASLLQDIQQSK